MVPSPPVIVHLPAFVAIAPLPPNIFPNKLASNVPTILTSKKILFCSFASFLIQDSYFHDIIHFFI